MNGVQSFLNAKLFLHTPVETVSEFEPWMFSSESPVMLPPPAVASEPLLIQQPEKEKEKEKGREFRPRSNKHTDALFECVYFLHHGHPIVDKNVETQEKMAMVKWVTENRSKLLAGLKASKLQEYTAEIMSSKQTSWGSLFLMCQYYTMNIRVEAEGRNMFMDFTCDAFVGSKEKIMRKDQYTFWVPCAGGDDDAEKIAVDFQQKTPLKAPGNYKIENLEHMAKRLGMDTSALVAPNNKKKDWYEAVYKALAW